MAVADEGYALTLSAQPSGLLEGEVRLAGSGAPADQKPWGVLQGSQEFGLFGGEVLDRVVVLGEEAEQRTLTAWASGQGVDDGVDVVGGRCRDVLNVAESSRNSACSVPIDVQLVDHAPSRAPGCGEVVVDMGIGKGHQVRHAQVGERCVSEDEAAEGVVGAMCLIDGVDRLAVAVLRHLHP